MNDFKRHLPHDTSLMALHVSLGRIWDALEAQTGATANAPMRTQALGASASMTSPSGSSAVRHNALLGIQGGDVDNYYHLTQAEWVGTGTGIVARQDSPSFTGDPRTATPPTADADTSIANTGWVKGQPSWLNKIQVADTDYTVTGAQGRMVAWTSITAPRSLNLPAATTSGQIIQVVDESGLCSNANVISIVPNGADTIEGEVIYTLRYAHASLKLESGGSDKWVIVTNPSQNLSAGVKVKPTITDLGTGSISVGPGTYAVYGNTDGTGKIMTHTLPGGTFALSDGVTNYVVVDHGSGTPSMRVTTNVTEIQETTIIPVYTIYREGTILHIFNWDELGDALSNKMHKSIVKTQRFREEPGGLALGEVATRIVTLSAGTVWTGAVATAMPAIRSDTSPMYLLYHSAGVWTKSAAITQYNNTQYDNGTNLQSLNPDRYAVNYVYRSVGQDNEMFIVLGTGNYTLSDAQLSQPPTGLPSLITSHCILVGRILVVTSGASAYQIDSAFATLFSPSAINNHNDLLGIQGGVSNEYYHLTSAEYAGTGTGVFARKTSPAFTGTPTAPTPSTADNSTLIATTAFVKSQGYATGTNWGVQKAIVDVAENMLVDVNYQHHILKSFTVYGTMTVNGESYVFDGVN